MGYPVSSNGLGCLSWYLSTRVLSTLFPVLSFVQTPFLPVLRSTRQDLHLPEDSWGRESEQKSPSTLGPMSRPGSTDSPSGLLRRSGSKGVVTTGLRIPPLKTVGESLVQFTGTEKLRTHPFWTRGG